MKVLRNNSSNLSSTDTSALISACVLLQLEGNILIDNADRICRNLCLHGLNDGMSAKASVYFSLHTHDYAHICK